MILRSANTCVSVAFKGLSGDGIDRGTLIFDGSVDPHFPKPGSLGLVLFCLVVDLTHSVLDTKVFLLEVLAKLILVGRRWMLIC